jgi:cell wall-associated NlpC family hydrolase
MERSFQLFAVGVLLLLIAAGIYQVWRAFSEPATAQTLRAGIMKNQVIQSPAPRADEVKRQEAVSSAIQFLGSDYQTGGAGPHEFDCSGLVYTVYREHFDCSFPRSSFAMHGFCEKVDPDSMLPGDWVFFDTNGGMNRVNHVGIYTGNDSFIHSSTRRGVIYSRLDTGFYQTCFWSAGRFKCP